MSGTANWVNTESDLARVQSAQLTLDKVKHNRYNRHNKYQLVKVCDHPATWKEVLVEGSNEVELDHTPVVGDEEEAIQEVNFADLAIKKIDDPDVDECEVIDDGMSPSTAVVKHEEQIISATLKIDNVDFGFGPGKLEINIHD